MSRLADLYEDQPLQPGSTVRTIRDGKAVDLQVVTDEHGNVSVVDPERPDRVQKLRRQDIAPVDDADPSKPPPAPGPRKPPTVPKIPQIRPAESRLLRACR